MPIHSTTENRSKWAQKERSIPPLPLRIALVTDDFLPAKTGVGVHVQKIAPELVRRGHSVIVLTSRRPGQPAFEIWNGVQVHRFNSVPLAGFYQALPRRSAISKILYENQVNVVHFHYLSFMMFNVLRVARTMGARTVFTAHMTVDVLTQPLFMKPFYYPITWGVHWLLNRMDQIICVSRHQIPGFKGLKAQTHVVSNPIEFRGDEASNIARSDTFVILYVGRLEPKKNVNYLVKAFQDLATQHPNIELRIAGAGVEEKALHQQVQATGLSKQVSFLGHVSHERLPALFASADVFVLPSILETQGMVVLEAMRFRLPVIITNKIISAQDLVEEGINGFIVNPDSVKDLSNKIAFLLENPDRRHQMGQAGFSRFPVESAASVAEKLESHYRGKVESTKSSPLPRICVVCGAQDIPKEVSRIRSNVRRFREFTFEIWRCGLCGSLHTEKVTALSEYYRDYPLRQGKLDYFTRVWYGNLLRRLETAGLKKNHRILDFGCGHGLLLKFFKEKGYTHAVGYDAYSDGYKDPSLLQQKYDWVLAIDVLEHMEDPRKFLKQARSLLITTGHLCLETPNAEGIDLADPEKNLHALHLPYHIHILSNRGLVQLARKEGFLPITSTLKYFMDSAWPGTSVNFIETLIRAQGNDIDSIFKSPRVWLFIVRPWLMVLFFFGYFFPKTKAEMMVIFCPASD